MSRSLDIAKILRATELDNTENNRLLYEGEDVRGVDSATVQSTGMQYYSTLDSLPTTNLEVGLLSFVEENRRLYLSDGNGWYNTAYVASALPYWVTEPDSTYEIIDSATPLTITALANDSDNPLLVNQSFGSDSQEFMATVSNDSSVFTFTPKSADSISQSVIAGDLTDSNGDFVYTFKWSDGVNFVAKEVTITYNITSSGGGSSWYGSRAWSTGGRTSDTSAPYSGYNNTIHLSIPTQSNSTQTQDIFSYPGQVGFQASGVSDSTCLVVGGSDTGPTSITDIRNFNCATLGASVSHGSLTPVFTNGEDGYMNNGSLSDGDRCVFQAAFDYQTGTSTATTMGYVSIQNAGDATDFGELTQGRRGTASSNDSTRGLFVGGEAGTGGYNTIDYITIQTAGDATDFGDYNYSVRSPASTSDATMTIVSGGRWAGSAATMYNTYCGYVTIQTPGNASSFGNLQNARREHMMSSDGTYAVTWGGRAPGTPSYALAHEYQVFATQGNATEFSELGNYALYNGGHGSGNAS